MSAIQVHRNTQPFESEANAATYIWHVFAPLIGHYSKQPSAFLTAPVNSCMNLNFISVVGWLNVVDPL